jgi:hypothetical protein
VPVDDPPDRADRGFGCARTPRAHNPSPQGAEQHQPSSRSTRAGGHGIRATATPPHPGLPRHPAARASSQPKAQTKPGARSAMMPTEAILPTSASSGYDSLS